MGKGKKEVKEETAIYSWDSYPACLPFLAMRERGSLYKQYKERLRPFRPAEIIPGMCLNQGALVTFSLSFPPSIPLCCLRTLLYMYDMRILSYTIQTRHLRSSQNTYRALWVIGRALPEVTISKKKTAGPPVNLQDGTMGRLGTLI